MRAQTRCLTVALALLCGLACGDDETGPQTGTVVVNTISSGDDLDEDGYIVILKGVSSDTIGANDEKTFTLVTPGRYEVELKGIAPNCHGEENPRTIDVQAGATTRTTFDIQCEPGTGSIAVTTLTSGVDVDDQYALYLDDAFTAVLSANDIYTTGRLQPGEHLVELRDVRSNCEVGDQNPRTVNVVAGQATSTTFSVECSLAGGTVTVTLEGKGKIEAHFYTISLDAGAQTSLILLRPGQTTSSITFFGVAAGEHTVEIQDLLPGCSIQGDNPRTATVVDEQDTELRFVLDCP